MKMRSLLVVGFTASALMVPQSLVPVGATPIAPGGVAMRTSGDGSGVSAAARKPVSSVAGWYSVLHSGHVEIHVKSNAKKVQVSYRTANNKKRVKTLKVRRGFVHRFLPKGSKRIKARSKATRRLHRSPWKYLPLRPPVVQRALKLPILHTGEHSCAAESNGIVKCWGPNSWGQVSPSILAGSEPALAPIAVPGVTAATSVALTATASCALLKNGTVKCWGADIWGALGDGPVDRGSYNPARTVPGLAGVTSLAAGAWHVCALLTNRTVKCWGLESAARHSAGAISPPNAIRSAPTQVPGLTGVVGIRAGAYATCALLSTGTVKCLGHNTKGDLTNTALTGPLVSIKGVAGGVADLAIDGLSGCVVLNSGVVKCWGLDRRSHYGLFVAATAPGVTGARRVALGNGSACAVVANGLVKCWGNDYYGTLGDGASREGWQPPRTALGVLGATEVGLGSQVGCSSLVTGRVKCWGSGVLGDGLWGSWDPPRRAVEVLGVKIQPR